MDFLSPAAIVPALKEAAEKAERETGRTPKGCEVGYQPFSVNGRMLGRSEPIWVRFGERVLFRVLNGSATEIRSTALPRHVFTMVALDGNPVHTPAEVPVLWIGRSKRVSAIVEMKHPGVWVLGDDGHVAFQVDPKWRQCILK